MTTFWWLLMMTVMLLVAVGSCWSRQWLLVAVSVPVRPSLRQRQRESRWDWWRSAVVLMSSCGEERR